MVTIFSWGKLMKKISEGFRTLSGGYVPYANPAIAYGYVNP